MNVKSKYRGTKEYHLIFNELITAAQYRGTVTYQEIAIIMGLPLSGGYMAGQVGKVLGEISEDEINNGRPMLSAIAVGVSGLPGPGFYKIATDLEKLKENTEEVQLKFWETEKAAVYETWRVKLSKNAD